MACAWMASWFVAHFGYGALSGSASDKSGKGTCHLAHYCRTAGKNAFFSGWAGLDQVLLRGESSANRYQNIVACAFGDKRYRLISSKINAMPLPP